MVWTAGIAPAVRERVTMIDLVYFWAYAVWHFVVKQTWKDLPGPAPVKVALLLICLAIPGPQDELLLIAFTRVCRAYRARQAAR